MARFPTISNSSRNYDFLEDAPSMSNETKKDRSNCYNQADKPHNECFGCMSLKIIASEYGVFSFLKLNL
jgi:hypothetical protein